MTSSHSESTTPNLAAIWSTARRLHPIYSELAREFAFDLPGCPALDAGEESPGRETVEQAQQWLNAVDERLQAHQLRQFLQTSSLVDPSALVDLLQHLLAKTTRTDALRDKIDFLLVQYFSQSAPTDVDDDNADLAFVAHGVEPVIGKVELKPPVWLNAVDRVLDSALRCRSLDELLHGGVLEQGRKAKAQAGDLFYLPIALVAFTRFGYLMRRVFFRLMLADLNNILDGLAELEAKGIETIDCRRAQFSAQEPILRLRMICQSWKVMFQAEYSSGQPLRMLVDLRASVDAALGGGTATGAAVRKAAVPDANATSSSHDSGSVARHASAASAGNSAVAEPSGSVRAAVASPGHMNNSANGRGPSDVAEFEVAAAVPDWDANPHNGSSK
jgi:hypothetical protein